MIGNQIKMFVIVMCSLAAVTALAAGIILVFHHGLGMRIKTQATRFDESARELDNPNRGFYFIYDFWITDSETDYESVVADRYQKDSETNLTLIQICLQDYQEGEISEAGMKNIRALFQALEVIDKQLIVRFVYDREGEKFAVRTSESKYHIKAYGAAGSGASGTRWTNLHSSGAVYRQLGRDAWQQIYAGGMSGGKSAPTGKSIGQGHRPFYLSCRSDSGTMAHYYTVIRPERWNLGGKYPEQTDRTF